MYSKYLLYPIVIQQSIDTLPCKIGNLRGNLDIDNSVYSTKRELMKCLSPVDKDGRTQLIQCSITSASSDWGSQRNWKIGYKEQSFVCCLVFYVVKGFIFYCLKIWYMISLLLFLSEHIESLVTKNVTKKVPYPCLVLNSSVQNTLESCVDQIQRKVLVV